MPSSQEVLAIVIGVGLFLVLIFYFRRFSGIQSSTQLHLKSRPRKNSSSQDVTFITKSTATLESSDEGVEIKDLNVLFMYNGHSFDAHEVLGIPPGAAIKMAEEAYLRAMAKVDASTRPFVEAAFQAIKQNNFRGQ